MSYLFLALFIAGLLLGVRLMFYGAERRHPSTALPLRRSEPALVAFLVVFGLASYLLTRNGVMSVASGAATGLGSGVVVAGVVTWLAVATARMQPEHDPDDPRFVLQGRVGVVTVDIPAGGEGMMRYPDVDSMPTVRARDIAGASIAAGQEVCIERIEDGVAHVELWSLVEARL